MHTVSQGRLRAAFARQLSEMYAREVPAYQTLVEVCREVNSDVLREHGGAAERLGSISRVTEERHGAIRVGTPDELRAVARIFGALGMHPVGFYDLRDAAANAVPVVSTAFRPLHADELAQNPFRVFTSMLATDDARFFDADLRVRLANFLAARQLFAPELLVLADQAERDHELPVEDARRFLSLAVSAFELSTEPVDRGWYEELERVSAVAADIGGVASTHVNHLTPRVLDIDALYQRMRGRGVAMIDTIQGPPRWPGPDVLLRQTSFRALAEPRRLREDDGTVTAGALRVRFGEVEARGIALTRGGRSHYDELLERIECRLRDDPTLDRAEVARSVWVDGFPDSERGLFDRDLAFRRYGLGENLPGGLPPADLAGLVEQGWVRQDPIVYEDFLPRSAAGIFQSNLTGQGVRDDRQQGTGYDLDRLAGILEREVHDPLTLYARQQEASAAIVATQLGLPAFPATAARHEADSTVKR